MFEDDKLNLYDAGAITSFGLALGILLGGDPVVGSFLFGFIFMLCSYIQRQGEKNKAGVVRGGKAKSKHA